MTLRWMAGNGGGGRGERRGASRSAGRERATEECVQGSQALRAAQNGAGQGSPHMPPLSCGMRAPDARPRSAACCSAHRIGGTQARRQTDYGGGGGGRARQQEGQGRYGAAPHGRGERGGLTDARAGFRLRCRRRAVLRGEHVVDVVSQRRHVRAPVDALAGVSSRIPPGLTAVCGLSQGPRAERS
jgi:hypothetical protein